LKNYKRSSYELYNRLSVWEEMNNSDEPVKQYLKNEFRRLLSQKYIDEWISAHLEYTEQGRANFIIGRMSEIVEG
jgi:hypothetical protein